MNILKTLALFAAINIATPAINASSLRQFNKPLQSAYRMNLYRNGVCEKISHAASIVPGALSGFIGLQNGVMMGVSAGAPMDFFYVGGQFIATGSAIALIPTGIAVGLMYEGSYKSIATDKTMDTTAKIAKLSSKSKYARNIIVSIPAGVGVGIGYGPIVTGVILCAAGVGKCSSSKDDTTTTK